MEKDGNNVLRTLGNSAGSANQNLSAPWLGVVVFALMLFGVVMVYSASARADSQVQWAQFWNYASLRQVVFVPVAVLVMLAASRWPVQWWRIGRYWISPSTLLLALAVAVVGLLIAWLLDWLIGSPPADASEQNDKPVSILYHLPGMVIIAATLAVLALLFFGIRAYLMGISTRAPILKNRRKIKTN